MNTIFQSQIFKSWLSDIKNMQAKMAIIARIRRMEIGHFGDYKSVGGDVLEIRVHSGPGYRIYFMGVGEKVYLLLAGGDKSTQGRDIALAHKLAKERKLIHGI